jgi:hypothetical protein
MIDKVIAVTQTVTLVIDREARGGRALTYKHAQERLAVLHCVNAYVQCI